MLTSIGVLDDALDRVSALDFEIPNPFVNHAPMACEALSVLGFDATIGDWVSGFTTQMHQAVQPVTPHWGEQFDWESCVGDYRLLPEWMGYFERAIADDGWRDVVALWVPRFMPGLVAALFHGIIRTSHAVRAIHAADTPARRAELARALGNWATWFIPGEPVDEGTELGDPRSIAMTAASFGARCYATAPTIFNLHGVTGAMAVHLLVEHLPPGDGTSAVTHIQAEHRVLYDGIRPGLGNAAETGWDDKVAVAASESHDPHQVKLVEACRRGFEATGDPGFSAAARIVTNTQS